MSRLKLGELFAGYGGLGMAVEHVFDAKLAWYAEFDDAPSKIMAHHWPDVPNHRDVTSVDWSQVEPVDIISGGSPCQDLSGAGRRAGMTEGTRSNLWVSMREAIATIKPKYVVWENVRGAYSAKADSALEHCPGCMGEAGARERHLRAFGRVLGDLSDLGYDAEWRGLPASSMGAPHARYRVFLLATKRGDTAPDAFVSGGHQSQLRGERETAHSGRQATIPNPSDFRSCLTADPYGLGSVGRDDASGESAQGRPDGPLSVPDSEPSQSEPTLQWGEYASAIRLWEQYRGVAPYPAELRAPGKYRLKAAFAEWMMGLAPGHVTGVPGLTRNEELKAIGNGVCPQQAVAALRDMVQDVMEYDINSRADTVQILETAVQAEGGN
ncbi:DNA cytosine methyltransferase [Glutamicibacter arilaitensis]|uniref:DNA cytosine methyltransferase n=1 Tax=Glutamicibacter arilaitensis TaxID=256701 RepID=UPI003FCF08C1